MKKVAIHNLGCKVNAYEAEAMEENLENNGYEIVSFTEFADIYIVNTCVVTNVASRKSRQMLNKAKKNNPEAIIVAAGCYAHNMEQEKSIDDIVDVIIGNNNKKDLVHILSTLQTKSKTKISNEEASKIVVDINNTAEFENLQIAKLRERTRINIKIQDGCNQFCSFCIIPLVRGRVRSRNIEDVLLEVDGLAKNGCKEVVLTGINLSSYGIDLDNRPTILDLIVRIHVINGIERIRLGSLEPGLITDDFVKALSRLEKFCPHFHLSLQSGCDNTLKRMNRNYSNTEYLDKCKLIRKYFDHPSITTDVIVGFPGETEEEFLTTRNFVEKVGFHETHIFKYSKREGTKAAKMSDQVSSKDKNSRSEDLIKLGERQKNEFEKHYIGREVQVLVEGKAKLGNKEYYVGHTKEYLKVYIDTKKDISNQVIHGKLHYLDGNNLGICIN